MPAIQEKERRFISSRDNFELPDFCCPSTAISFSWAEFEEVSPEQIIGDVVEGALDQMSPKEADDAIERARATLASYRVQGKRK